MVSATALPVGRSALLGDTSDLLTLRVCGSEHDGRVLHIRSPKCTIGADRSCTLRLRGLGIRPFHCLILRGTEGMFVRRLSADTCLNGQAFDVARLRPADRLAVGPVELEVLPAIPSPEMDAPIAPQVVIHEPSRDATELTERCRLLESQLDDARHERDQLHAAVVQLQVAVSRLPALDDELRAARCERETACAESAVAAGRAELLDSQLSEVRRQLESAVAESVATAGRIQVLEQELSGARRSLDDERTTATRTRDELEAQLQAREQRLTDTQKRLADRQLTDETNWKDVAERLRAELQQTREEHRRVREEWHVDRLSLEQKLAERSEALAQLDQKHKQDVREAETLIHSMQQEGKLLLAQLEEARQTIHQDVDRRKKRQSLVHPASGDAPPAPPPAAPASAPAATALQQTPAVPPSACPTIVLAAGQLPLDASPTAPPAAAPETTAPTSADATDDDEGVVQRYMERLLRRSGRPE
jgi:hypothetical protein